MLSALFAEAPIGLATWDREFRFERINDVLAEINGVGTEAHIGRRLAEVLPQLGPQLEEMFAGILATGRPELERDIVGETPAAPGVTRHWRASYLPVRDEHGEVTGIAATVVEVTGEREASARAGRATRRTDAIDAQLRAVYSALPVGVGFVTPDLRYQRVNDALARINGLAADEHLGRTVREVLGEHAVEAEKLIRDVMQQQAPIQFEMAIPASPPHELDRVLSITYFPVHRSDGDLLGVGAVVRDITEQRALEREREDLLQDALTARAQADTQRARAEAAQRRASFLATVTRRMAASFDYERTLREIASSAVPYIADWCVVTVLRPGGGVELFGFRHRDPVLQRLGAEFVRTYQPGAASSITRAIASGEGVIITDVTDDRLRALAQDERHLELLHELGVRHMGTWPIRSPDGTVIGALSFILGDSGRRFTEEDLELAQTVASRAGLHLTNARLSTERAEIAQVLQASLLPHALPHIPGVEMAATFLPAGDATLVGGDFLDVFPAADGRWTAILGDVSGKGVAAAAITGSARHTLRAAALLDESPAANLALLNRVLLSDVGSDAFCTVVAARLSPGANGLTVRMANAGHLPPLLRRSDGSVAPVSEGAGPLVGVFAAPDFAETTVRLDPGDLLLLYTDGLTEVRGDDATLGERELISTLRTCADATADAVVEAITQCAGRLHGSRPHDDIAALAIRCPAAS